MFFPVPLLGVGEERTEMSGSVVFSLSLESGGRVKFIMGLPCLCEDTNSGIIAEVLCLINGPLCYRRLTWFPRLVS